MYVYKERHDDVCRVHTRRTRAAAIYSFVRENITVKYRNSRYYKGSVIWDGVHIAVCDSQTLI